MVLVLVFDASKRGAELEGETNEKKTASDKSQKSTTDHVIC
jgi:hypothetical protein